MTIHRVKCYPFIIAECCGRRILLFVVNDTITIEQALDECKYTREKFMEELEAYKNDTDRI